MIKLKSKPNKRSKHIEMIESNIRRVFEYQMTNMTSAIHIDENGYVTYYTSKEMINTTHPRYALPFIKKAYAKYIV